MISRRSFLRSAPLLLAACRPSVRAPGRAARTVRITLQARVARPGREIVSFGVPMPPGMVADARQIGVRADDGTPIEAAVTVLERWPQAGHTVRSARVQLAIDLHGQSARAVDVILDDAAPARPPGPSPAVSPVDAKGPSVWALLPATWLCDSLVAGPQVPAERSGPYRDYDAFVDRQFDGSLKYIASGVYQEWLFDRTTCWYKMYVRTGELKFLAAAHEAAHFVLDHTMLSGPDAGAFTLKDAVDPKYVYPRAMHLHYLLTGDERMRDAGVAMANLHLRTLDPVYDPTAYVQPPANTDPERTRQFWSPRQQAYGLLGVLHGWELTGEPAFRDKARACIDAYHAHQTHPPDGLPSDGSWRQNWALYDPSEATYPGATSAWMTAILLDALFHEWTISRDPRIPQMVTRWCDFLDRRGFVPDGSSAYYVVDCLSPEPAGQVGPDMFLHNMEIAYTFAMGIFFTSDPGAEVRYRKRFATAFRRALTVDLNETGRSYNWAFQASSQLVYFVMNPGRGVAAAARRDRGLVTRSLRISSTRGR